MDEKDELQREIDRAKAALPAETRKAIDSVDWREAIALMQGKGYTLEQLGYLEIETELLVCGLITPEEYPKELEKQMSIQRERAQELVKEMNTKVFSKIRDKLIENTTGKNLPALAKEGPGEDLKIESREEILKRLEQPEIEAPHPIVAQKLSGPMQMPSHETIHSLDNLSKSEKSASLSTTPAPPHKKYDLDPYREKPE